MSPLYSFLSAEVASLGRFNKDCLSEQIIMELFVEPFVPKRSRTFKDENGDFTDIASWHPLLQFDSVGCIIKICFDFTFAGGELHLENLPPHMQEVRVNSNKLTGEVDLTSLPEAMEFLNVEWNELTGTIDLSQLPPKFGWFNCHHNKLSGQLDLRCLSGRIGDRRRNYEEIPEGDTTRQYTLDFTENNFEDRILLGKESDYRTYGMFDRIEFREFIFER